jgi:hypothetical protein
LDMLGSLQGLSDTQLWSITKQIAVAAGVGFVGYGLKALRYRRSRRIATARFVGGLDKSMREIDLVQHAGGPEVIELARAILVERHGALADICRELDEESKAWSRILMTGFERLDEVVPESAGDIEDVKRVLSALRELRRSWRFGEDRVRHRISRALYRRDP